MTRWLAVPQDADRTSALADAIRQVKRGRVVVLPTDAGYVYAADAFSVPASDELRRLTALPESTSLNVMIGRRSTLDGIARDIPTAARAWLPRHWPGALTLIVSAQPSLRWGAGRRRFAVRMPLHPAALQVAREVGPLAVAAVSREGATSLPAESSIDPAVSIVLDVGSTALRGTSTVVDVTVTPARVLRPGSIDVNTLRAAAPGLVAEDAGPTRDSAQGEQ